MSPGPSRRFRAQATESLMKPSIVLYEPQCTGYSHANFNAALLQTTLLAYPETQLAFWGEREHLNWVRAAFEQHIGSAPSRVEWVNTHIPPKEVLGLGKVAQHRRAYEELLQAVAAPEVELLVLCSLSSVGLHVIKRLLHKQPLCKPIVGVLHGALSALAGTRSKNPANWWFTPRRALGLPHPPGLRYIALGPSIFRSLERLLPDQSTQFSTLDIPTLWSALPNERTDETPVRFGYFGVGRIGLKGFELFCRLAMDLGDAVKRGRCEFVLVGFLLGDASHNIPGIGNVTGLSRSPLPPEEYTRRAASTTYAVWAGQSEQYALRASASFVDTLCMGRPGIYLRAPYVESYYEQMGDIGFLCDDYEQMRQAAVAIAEQFSEDRYQQQCSNVLEGSRVFQPQVLAPRLRAVVARCRQELASVD